MTDPETLDALDPVQLRVLACLVEKEGTTPEAYPLTENALVLACNQKTGRDPVMNLTPGQVGHALRTLEDRGLVRSVHGARAQRWEHRFAQHYSLTRAQQALLAVLALRGPQTVSELTSRTERLARFADAEELRHALERLAAHAPAYAVNLGRGAGQREDRWMHLLGGPVDTSLLAAAREAPAAGGRAALEQRVDGLEAEVAELRETLAGLLARLEG
ncbi:YceH family protein [Coralloluteibacterium thermophilus]|uniref:YceH family protein n=1 Tax=Coralloluteibacterium thermophilum TaxID=2707049 RepID=A0ABV9NM76_9GAMM